MATLAESGLEQVLAIDIGATTIKFCHVDAAGVLLEVPRRRPTPYPCSPERLVELLNERIQRSSCPRVGVGFPGEFTNGCVVRPGNLSRPGGVTTDRDPGLDRQWRGYEFERVLRETSSRDVRVVNDATLAALGCCTGVGIELVLTLGTGVGLALERDGVLEKVRDVGAAEFRDGRTFDQTLGERARSSGPEKWFALLEEAIKDFADEFEATTVHLAGGNARRVAPDLFTTVPRKVLVSGNEAPLRGAARLFYN